MQSQLSGSGGEEGGLSDRIGSITVMKSVARRYFPGKKYAEFNYFMGSGSEKREYHGVLSIEDNGCFPVVEGNIIKQGAAKSPHAFLKTQHPGRTSSNGIRQYSAPGIIMMLGKTLAEWKHSGAGTPEFERAGEGGGQSAQSAPVSADRVSVSIDTMDGGAYRVRERVGTAEGGSVRAGKRARANHPQSISSNVRHAADAEVGPEGSFDGDGSDGIPKATHAALPDSSAASSILVPSAIDKETSPTSSSTEGGSMRVDAMARTSVSGSTASCSSSESNTAACAEAATDVSVSFSTSTGGGFGRGSGQSANHEDAQSQSFPVYRTRYASDGADVDFGSSISDSIVRPAMNSPVGSSGSFDSTMGVVSANGSMALSGCRSLADSAFSLISKVDSSAVSVSARLEEKRQSAFILRKLEKEANAARAEVIARVEALNIFPQIPFILTPQSDVDALTYKRFYNEPQNKTRMMKAIEKAEEIRSAVPDHSKNTLENNINGLRSAVRRSEKLFADLRLKTVTMDVKAEHADFTRPFPQSANGGK